MGHFPGDLEKSAPSTAPSMGHGLLGHEFEDPPGLQEKVCRALHFCLSTLLHQNGTNVSKYGWEIETLSFCVS